MVAAGCALCLLACAGAGDGDADAGGTGTAGSTAGAGTTGSAGMTGGAGTTAAAGNGGSTGGAGSSGGGTGPWDCLDVPGTLCICYARAGTDAPTCSAGFRCCFQLNATSCECFAAEEDCTSAAAQYTQVAACPPH